MEGRANAYNSVPRERNMFKSIGTCGHVLRIEDLGLRKVVLADATRAVEGKHVSGQAAVDNAFATQTRHVSDTRKRRAVPANGRVRREGEHAATTLAPRKIFVSSRNVRQARAKGTSTYSFRDRERRSRTPMSGDHRQECRRLPIRVPFPCRRRCQPSSAS